VSIQFNFLIYTISSAGFSRSQLDWRILHGSIQDSSHIEIIMLHHMPLPFVHNLCDVLCYMSNVDTSLSGIVWLYLFTFTPYIIQTPPLMALFAHPS